MQYKPWNLPFEKGEVVIVVATVVVERVVTGTVYITENKIKHYLMVKCIFKTIYNVHTALNLFYK